MSKIVIQEVNLYTGSVGGTSVGTISNVVADSRELSIDPNEVEFDDGQVANESYVVRPTFRSRNVNFDGGGAILDASEIMTDGKPTTKVYFEFVGAPNSINIETGAMYVTGQEMFDNGRLEIMLTGQMEVITLSDGITSATATGT